MTTEVKSPYFARLAQPILESGLSLPVPIQRALDGEFMPLAVETRMLMPVWAKNRGYPEAQITQLQKVIRALCTSRLYRLSVSEDTSVRHDLDGYIVGLVSGLGSRNGTRRCAGCVCQAQGTGHQRLEAGPWRRLRRRQSSGSHFLSFHTGLLQRPCLVPWSMRPSLQSPLSVARPVDASRGTAVRTIEAPMRRR